MLQCLLGLKPSVVKLVIEELSAVMEESGATGGGRKCASKIASSKLVSAILNSTRMQVGIAPPSQVIILIIFTRPRTGSHVCFGSETHSKCGVARVWDSATDPCGTSKRERFASDRCDVDHMHSTQAATGPVTNAKSLCYDSMLRPRLGLVKLQG